MSQNGLKMSSFRPLVYVKWSTIIFGKTNFFTPFLTLIWSQKWPIFKAFLDF